MIYNCYRKRITETCNSNRAYQCTLSVSRNSEAAFISHNNGKMSSGIQPLVEPKLETVELSQPPTKKTKMMDAEVQTDAADSTNIIHHNKVDEELSKALGAYINHLLDAEITKLFRKVAELNERVLAIQARIAKNSTNSEATIKQEIEDEEPQAENGADGAPTINAPSSSGSTITLVALEIIPKRENGTEHEEPIPPTTVSEYQQKEIKQEIVKD
ncbi:hypothetical protein CAEBREN_14136 [Caenorhabditis brenneri]|uniref:Uncharacterized protein n=1 Tax=Caenorhabditis brenneri TaxID=135651 RepID=G0P2K5_CAEBE|nr:hypothetical protein CAEBREN_14136 [Caenorhabditis brenneri]